MDLPVEKRQSPRVETTWPVVIVSPDADIEGETKDLSVDGALILCQDMPKLENTFQLVLRPSRHRAIEVHAERVWSVNINFDGKRVLSGMGVRFTGVCHDDRQFLKNVISNYLYLAIERAQKKRLSPRGTERNLAAREVSGNPSLFLASR